MITIISIALAVVLDFSAERGDSKKIQSANDIVGSWTCVEVESSGKKISAEGITYHFKKSGKVKLAKTKDLMFEFNGDYVLEEKKDYFEINITFDKVDELAKDKKYTFWGVCKFEKDILFLCICDDPTGVRPTQFLSKENEFVSLLKLKRIEQVKD